MKSEQEMKIEIQRDVGELAKNLGLLSTKYKEEPLLDDAQKVFLNLSVHVSRALKIQLQ